MLLLDELFLVAPIAVGVLGRILRLHHMILYDLDLFILEEPLGKDRIFLERIAIRSARVGKRYSGLEIICRTASNERMCTRFNERLGRWEFCSASW